MVSDLGRATDGRSPRWRQRSVFPWEPPFDVLQAGSDQGHRVAGHGELVSIRIGSRFDRCGDRAPVLVADHCDQPSAEMTATAEVIRNSVIPVVAIARVADPGHGGIGQLRLFAALGANPV